MAGKRKIASPVHLNEYDRQYLKETIEQAGGCEVLSAAVCVASDTYSDVRIIARGTVDSAPAIIKSLRPGEVLLHNHPSGRIRPSDADLGVASICGKSGIGFAIHNNDCTEFYVVVEPYIEEKPEKLSKKEMIAYISENGPIAEKLKNYEQREGQIELMGKITDAFNQPCHAILEGETGIGKSMAYLIPSIFYSNKNKCRVCVSTNTINLQYQLVDKDLPFLAQILPVEFKYCLLKGRNNYICLRRIREATTSDNADFLLDEMEFPQFQKLVSWAEKTTDGSLSDLTWVPVETLWDKLCCDKDSCPGVKCSDYNDCFFYNARRKAAEADILVVNHSLLFSDLALRAETSEYSQTAVIPACKAIIIDEAHNLEDTATKHFGFRTTATGFQRILNKIYQKRGRKESGTFTTLANALAFKHGDISDSDRESLLNELNTLLIPCRMEISDIAKVLFDSIATFLVNESTQLGEYRLRITEKQERTNEFLILTDSAKKVITECKRLTNAMKKFARRLNSSVDNFEDDNSIYEVPYTELNNYANRVDELSRGLMMMFETETENRSSYVHFFTTNVRKTGRYTSISSLPIEISQQMIDYCFTKIPCTIMVSGTMTTGGNFNFLKNRLGLFHQEIADCLIEGRYKSPFDYQQQSRLFIPSDLPDPSSSLFVEQATQPLLEIIKSSLGGTLVLCTSYSHLNMFYNNLAPILEANGISCYKQGDFDRQYLVELFKEDGSAVLFGTDSFWEGVDIPGSALRNLVILKLPFASPNDPVLEARNERIKEDGGNPFKDYQLPMAAIKLKQGFGRLVRTKLDRGTVWILDNRIINKSYGSYFIDSLPDSPVVKGKFKILIKIAQEFFNNNL